MHGCCLLWFCEIVIKYRFVSGENAVVCFLDGFTNESARVSVLMISLFHARHTMVSFIYDIVRDVMDLYSIDLRFSKTEA